MKTFKELQNFLHVKTTGYKSKTFSELQNFLHVKTTGSKSKTYFHLFYHLGQPGDIIVQPEFHVHFLVTKKNICP